jgi:hypothetical protein
MSGSTGSIIYDKDYNITQNSVKLKNNILYLQLGYIMANQTVVSKNSFKKKAHYEINTFISKLNINLDKIEEEYLLQVEFNKFYTFKKNTQKISGLVIIE